MILRKKSDKLYVVMDVTCDERGNLILRSGFDPV